ncbi:MAG: GMC family oxidoreductase N-terminal domain-containing protein [Tepidamorphaceae bacterium]
MADGTHGIGTFDYVIVGAGTAGCVLANRLSEDPGTTVALLEAGGSDNYHWIHIPVGYLYCIGNPRTDWGFKTTPQKGLNGRAIGYPRGRVLGGCSSINGMLYLRGQAADTTHWRQLGNVGWAWDDVLPYFIKSEDYYAGAAKCTAAAANGALRNNACTGKCSMLSRDACIAAGIPATDDFNRGDNFGVGYFKVNQKAGWRWSAAKGFLKPARQRPNLKVITHAQAERILFEGKRATGIRFDHNGESRTITARREVLLASGAVGTPQLMQLSGVGPGGLLQQHGINVLHDAPDVGGNLQDHLQIRCAYKVHGVKTLNTLANSLWGKAMIGLEYALFRSGPMSMAPSQLCAFAKSSGRVATPDLEYHVQPLSLDAFGQPPHPFPAITASVCNLRPESRGTIRIASPDPKAHPDIDPNYLDTEGDRQVAAAGIRLTRKIVSQEPMQRYRPEEFKPGPQAETDADLAKAAGDIGTTIFHPVGTCRMGADDKAVVDPSLKVKGLDALRVIDASVMPAITSGNTNSPVIMIAEAAADRIRAGN